MGKRILACMAAVLVLLPVHAMAVPAPADVELGDVANDDGSALAVSWNWNGTPAESDLFSFEVRINEQLLDHFALTERQQKTLTDARSWLVGQIADVLTQRDAAKAEMDAAQSALDQAILDKEPDGTINQKRHEYWQKYRVHKRLDHQVNRLHNAFSARTYAGEDLRLKALTWEFLNEALRSGKEWISVADPAPMASVGTRGDRSDLFGVNSASRADAGMLFYTFDTISVPNPGTADSSDEATGLEQFRAIPVRLVPDIEYQVRMSTFGTVPANPMFPEAEAGGPQLADVVQIGTAAPIGNAFDKSKLNNLIFALLFGGIILTFIILARRNPNMFIRRIAGLEAVDEAIGRATEMGKPVMYLCGLQSLSELSTLAAINILGRVAGKIADYESDLIVPNRDPVVQTVAQEVVKEGYATAGRPDAYREDNIFFLTDDQFSFTAATCGIMMRDKPAAIFLMGYYYAESLLLAETGADTGAIQIAGTDAEHQLPFFIVTCDYTLIGEELYAASAYLSREPMLLGSLKGQDIAKAFMMAIILLQAILFIFSAQWDVLRDLVTPL
ncbi:hypothetical protein KDL29_12775 [bacterium]|nr:hypothetical protein [bacterium]UNM09305.1 MAG: hypothetical protein H7A35_04435 [Planctomycetales bacterium]